VDQPTTTSVWHVTQALARSHRLSSGAGVNLGQTLGFWNLGIASLSDCPRMTASAAAKWPSHRP
jgi:hypothetical protein